MEKKHKPSSSTMTPAEAFDELLKSNDFTGITFGDSNPTIGEIYNQISKAISDEENGLVTKSAIAPDFGIEPINVKQFIQNLKDRDSQQEPVHYCTIEVTDPGNEMCISFFRNSYSEVVDHSNKVISTLGLSPKDYTRTFDDSSKYPKVTF